MLLVATEMLKLIGIFAIFTASLFALLLMVINLIVDTARRIKNYTNRNTRGTLTTTQ